MITLRSRSGSRTVSVRRVLTVPVVLLVALVAVLAAPVAASADTPAAWETPPPVSGLDFLLVLLVFPLGLALIITVLTVIPSLVRDKGYQPGESWRSEAEWFGGPTKGVGAADDKQLEAAESDRGGASGSW